MNLPEFEASEVNELASRARHEKGDYYKKCHEFVIRYLDMTPDAISKLSEKQSIWLWGIKSDLREDQ